MKFYWTDINKNKDNNQDQYKEKVLCLYILGVVMKMVS
jgi:hypothetical protein